MPSRRRLRLWRRRSRPVLLLLLATSVVLLIGAGFVVVEALHLRTAVETARAEADSADKAISRGDLPEARRQLERAGASTRRADRVTGSTVWRLYGHVPVLGLPLRELRALTVAADGLVRQVLPPLLRIHIGGATWTGAVDLDAVTAARPPLRDAATSLEEVRRRLARAPTAGIQQISTRRQALVDILDDLDVRLRELNVATDVVPQLLGQDRPQRVLLLIQNPAEARATGGLVGAYGLLETDRGRFRLTASGPNTDLRDSPDAAVSLGPEFEARYGRERAASVWRSANLTPDLRDAGRIFAALAQRQTGVSVDAVVLVDPVSLSMILAATGPVSLPDGDRLTKDNAVDLLLRDVYAKFPDPSDNATRDNYLQVAMRAVVQRLQTRAVDAPALARALGRATATGHLQAWAADKAVESRLLGSRAGGALPGRGPLLSVVTQDVGGSKLDYYLRRQVSYVARPTDAAVDLGNGPELEEQARVTVRLTNKAPASGLPAYVTARADRPVGAKPVPGEAATWLSVYLGPRATLLDAQVNGRAVLAQSDVDHGLSVFSVYVSTAPGAVSTLVLDVRQPAARGARLIWRQQPRLVDDELTVERSGTRAAILPVYAPLASR